MWFTNFVSNANNKGNFIFLTQNNKNKTWNSTIDDIKNYLNNRNNYDNNKFQEKIKTFINSNRSIENIQLGNLKQDIDKKKSFDKYPKCCSAKQLCKCVAVKFSKFSWPSYNTILDKTMIALAIEIVDKQIIIYILDIMSNKH